LGFRLSIETNSKDILLAAEESWGSFQELFHSNPIRLRIAVSDEGKMGLPVPSVKAQGNLISFIGDAENFCIGDLHGGFGFCWVTPTVADHREFLRYHYLDALVLTLIDALYVSTIHAACVALDGRGVLLCGESTAGKSSFAYACARQGWEYLCDDASALVRNRSDRTVVGNPYRLRLRPDAGQLFPEIQGRLTRERPNGKMSIELSTASDLSIRLAASCQIHGVIFLDRTERETAALMPVAKDRALDQLAEAIPFGSAQDRENRVMDYRNLLDVPTYKIRYSDLDGAVGCLASMMRSGR